MEKAAAESAVLTLPDGHWSAAAHAVVGGVLSAEVRRLRNR